MVTQVRERIQISVCEYYCKSICQKKIKQTTVSMIVRPPRLGRWPSFASRGLEQDEATESNGVPKHLEGGDLGPEEKHRAGDQ